jgi:hypothetical protein
LIAILSIAWFWKYGGKRRNDDDAEECLVGKRRVAFPNDEGLDSKEKDPLLQGGLEEEEEDVDAPPPYTKHVRG